ncbi:MAG: hypothetical protein IJR89_05685 [Clostridia bacterium]|nr:hypothetical protein [Clostridia bacterium]
MKRLLSPLLLLALLLAFAGCAPSERAASPVPARQGKTVGEILAGAKETNAPTTPAAPSESESSPEPEPETDAPAETENSVPVTAPVPAVTAKKRTCDLDLTVLGSTMVYSKVYDMMQYPSSYLGKTIRMRGLFAVAEGEDRNYYACLIADATACCSQGIEFVLPASCRYPQDYPALGSEITVVGVFDVYSEGGNRYCQLLDAALE